MAEENNTFTVRYDATYESPIDIHKLIDDALEKKDRYVNIFITNVATSVYVYPCDDANPRWIAVRGGFECSECRQLSLKTSPCCPICGERLAGVEEK